MDYCWIEFCFPLPGLVAATRSQQIPLQRIPTDPIAKGSQQIQYMDYSWIEFCFPLPGLVAATRSQQIPLQRIPTDPIAKGSQQIQYMDYSWIEFCFPLPGLVAATRLKNPTDPIAKEIIISRGHWHKEDRFVCLYEYIYIYIYTCNWTSVIE